MRKGIICLQLKIWQIKEKRAASKAVARVVAKVVAKAVAEVAAETREVARVVLPLPARPPDLLVNGV